MLFKERTVAVLSFVKKEAVFFIAFLCALVSSFFVPPSSAYFAYIDCNTLFILFALMGVVGAFRSCGIFERIGIFLCGKVSTVRPLCFVLVMLCFFSSMLITNDVALITFVPLTVELLGGAGIPSVVMLTVVFQTIAANTGSMLTPLGNPQNLFLFGKMGLSVSSFILILLPYTALCFICLCACMFFVPAKMKVPALKSGVASKGSTLKTAVYGLLFILCLLSVVRIVPKWTCALCVLLVLLVLDRKILLKIDYMLLLTFVAFFIFTGNIASIDSVREFLMNIVKGNEYWSALASSQIISNVPATLLLYPFAQEGQEALLVGVNAGGLGTLVASLASLISFKTYSINRAHLSLPSAGKYLFVFTLASILFLVLLTALRFILNLVL